jgi:hypothetical protein
MALINRAGESEEENQAADQKKEKQEINIQALAERILRLLKEEARLERERLGSR